MCHLREVYILQTVNYKNKRSKWRQGPTLGVHFIKVHVKRERTLYYMFCDPKGPGYPCRYNSDEEVQVSPNCYTSKKVLLWTNDIVGSMTGLANLLWSGTWSPFVFCTLPEKKNTWSQVNDYQLELNPWLQVSDRSRTDWLELKKTTTHTLYTCKTGLTSKVWVDDKLS